MSTPSDFKSQVSGTSVKALARHLAKDDPSFPTRAFVRRATRGLDALELKARITHVADALAASLDEPFVESAARIRAACDVDDEPAWSVFLFWPLCTFIERHGLEHFDVAFETMHGLTRLASCEFAVRPFIEREPERAFERLAVWVTDDDLHVRRLVSEGTRPRLPWGGRLRALQADPTPSLALLDRLHDDSELFVRRSVANHLNDIAKDHPDLAVEVAGGWQEQRPGVADTEWVVRHAMRSLVKRGHAGALALQGFGSPAVSLESFAVSPRRLRFGSSLKLHLELRAEADGAWMVDYAVHHVKANGRLTPKVFKWTRRAVKKGDLLVLDKTHSIRAISTRRYHAGVHRCEVLVNGQSLATDDFELVDVPA